jgi:transcriptional regulator with XRE-family HTH domain
MISTKSPKAPHPTDRHVGDRVRMYRIKAGMSQEVLGKQLGVTFQEIQTYEKGSDRIGASRLQQIAEILGVAVASLFEGSPSAKPHEVDKEFVRFLGTSLGQRLVQGFMKIRDKEVRANLTHLIESISDKTPSPPRRRKKRPA